MWLRNAAIGLCALAAAAAAVSFTAQYRMVDADRHLAVVAGLEAAIPDAAALVFACLGVALALHGRRALRARAAFPGITARSACEATAHAAGGRQTLVTMLAIPLMTFPRKRLVQSFASTSSSSRATSPTSWST